MSERLHVIASFDSQEELLEGMRWSVGWVRVDEPELLALLSRKEPTGDDDGGQDGGGDEQGGGQAHQ